MISSKIDDFYPRNSTKKGARSYILVVKPLSNQCICDWRGVLAHFAKIHTTSNNSPPAIKKHIILYLKHFPLYFCVHVLNDKDQRTFGHDQHWHLEHQGCRHPSWLLHQPQLQLLVQGDFILIILWFPESNFTMPPFFNPHYSKINKNLLNLSSYSFKIGMTFICRGSIKQF